MKLFASLVLAFAVLGSSLQTARAHHPESEPVQQIVKQAVAYLRSDEGKRHSKLGGHALRGLAILKATDDHDDPDVVAEVNYVAQLGKLPVERLRSLEASQYSIGIAVIFLSAYDSQKYRAEIANYLAALLENQRVDGSWSYNHPNETSGDMSQTQYGVMASWVALKTAELSVESAVYEKALGWLIQKQFPDGSFAYKPDAPGENRTSISLTAAGAASALICADALGLFDKSKSDQDNGGLQRVAPKEAKVGPKPSSITRAQVMTTVDRANNYFDTNFSWRKTDSFYYFMYARERYMTFKELAANNRDAEFGEDEPAWYNDGVDLLAKQQQSDGSFRSINGTQIATSFAVLFLMRSTRSVVPIDGVLGGGDQLPKDVANLTERERGVVIVLKKAFDFDAMIQELDKGGEIDLSAYKDPKIERVDTSPNDPEIKKIHEALSSPRFEYRLLAVKRMAADGRLESVAGLIYALSDPDNRIAIEARNGLRSAARRFDGFGMPNEPNAAQKRVAQESWRKWLRDVQPTAKLFSP